MSTFILVRCLIIFDNQDLLSHAEVFEDGA